MDMVVVYLPSEKYEFVNWDDHSQYVEKTINVPNHQPESIVGI